ncbi:MAG: nucleotidyltransferase domain-containing protein [Sphingomonadaceae bacterium]
MQSDADLDLARRLIRTHIPVTVADLILFGSRARGDARRWSDIDVAVRPNAPLPVGLLAETRAALEESNLLLHVDLIDLRDASPALRQTIEREGIPWND